MRTIPVGTVTFLFTDVEGSTWRWEQYPSEMRAALARHDALLRAAIEQNGGYVFKTVGDAFYAAFGTPRDALKAALQGQHALQDEPWPGELGPLRVRMSLHTGAVEQREGDYFGQPLNRVARLLSAGHGGQVVLSAGFYEMVRDNVPPGVSFLDLGEHRLRDLIRPEHVFQVVAPGLPSEAPPLKTLDTHPNNLPLQPTPFIGRERELEEVQRMLLDPDVRLVTLTGAGGTGKTRLGLQVAADVLDAFDDGAWFVELSTLRDAALVESTIAQIFGLKESESEPPIELLKRYLQEKGALLVLDNFEQVPDAAGVVSKLLASCPRLKVLATTRSPLRLRGEHEYPVAPLSVPDKEQLRSRSLADRLTQYEAVRLFIERARAIKPDFEVTNDTAPAVAEICIRLDGLPLAVELAAARIRLFPPQAMLARLSASVQSSLNLLTGGSRDLPARQQTLRNAIEWSYDLLTEGEKQLFRRMAVFCGRMTLESLEAVCGGGTRDWGLRAGGSKPSDLDEMTPLQIDVVEGVESLVEKSLLVQREGRSGNPAFFMLETIRDFAWEKLIEASDRDRGEAAGVQWAHACYFLSLAEEAEPKLKGREQLEWLAKLEDELDNLRAVLSWCGRHGSGTSEALNVRLRLGAALGHFWLMRGDSREGYNHLSSLLAAVPTTETGQAEIVAPEREMIRAKAMQAAGVLATQLARYEEAHTHLEESLRICKRLATIEGMENAGKIGIAYAQWGLAMAVIFENEYALAEQYLLESLQIVRALGDRWGEAQVLHVLGFSHIRQGDWSSARKYIEAAVEIRRGLGDAWGLARSLNNLGAMLWGHYGDYKAGRAIAEETLARYRALGDRLGEGSALVNLGNIAYLLGDLARSRPLREEALSAFREIGHRSLAAETCDCLGTLAIVQGDIPAARALVEEALSVATEIDDRPTMVCALAHLGKIAGYEGDYARAMQLLAESRACTERAGLKTLLGVDVSEVGSVARWQGDFSRSAAVLDAWIEWYRSGDGSKPWLCQVIVERGLTAAAAGDIDLARTYLHEGLAMAAQMGQKYDAALALSGLASVSAESDPERAATLAGAVEALLEEMGAVMAPADRRRYEEALAAARACLDNEAAWRAAWQEGRLLSIEQAVELATKEPAHA